MARRNKNWEVIHSSKKRDYETPNELFEVLNSIFRFDIDVCASEENKKVERYWSKDNSCLDKKWTGLTCWMNPEYGSPEQPCKDPCKKKKCITRGWCTDVYIPGIEDFLKKAYWESVCGANAVVCLVPVRTGTSWWWDYVRRGTVMFLPGRLRFVGAPHVAPFDSAIVVFNRCEPRTHYWYWKNEPFPM